MSIEDILLAIKKGETFLITTHINPEGDAIGSSLALAIALSSIGKKISVCTADPVPKMLRFLPYSETVKQVKAVDGRFDAVIVVDCGDLERAGFLKKESLPADILINIDHHITNKGFGTLNLVEEAVASAEIVYQIIKWLGISVTPDIATCLYTAVMTETGSFRYSNTNLQAFRMAEEMVSFGANPWRIANNVYNKNSRGRAKLMGQVLSGMDISEDGRVAWITVREQMYRDTGTTKEDVEDLINFPRSIDGVEVAVLFRESVLIESEQGWKISLRSNGTVDVAVLSLEFGGGGHSMAAGFFIKGALEEVKERVIGRVMLEVRDKR